MIRYLFLALVLLWSCASRPAWNPEKRMISLKRPHHLVLAAPHGGYDLGTELITENVAKEIGWSSLIALNYRTREQPINVNRPSEGVGLRASLEKRTEAAKAIYAQYFDKVKELAPRLYVEIHGEAKLPTKIEVATVGVSQAQARELKSLLQRAIGAGKYTVMVEGADEIHYVAGGAKDFGILREVPLALHIELPRSARDDNGPTEKALAEFLPRAAALLLGERK